MSWVLRLVAAEGDVKVTPARRVAGLTMPLRLALSAQAGGACRVEVQDPALLPLLRDPRLRVPVTPVADSPNDDSSPDAIVEAPWNLVSHRDRPKALVAAHPQGTSSLATCAVDHEPPFGFDPIVVTDGRSAWEAESALLHSLRKVQDGWTSTWLNRYVSLFLTRWLVRTPLRPNQVSIGILAVGLFGAWLATRGTYWTMLAGAFLFQLQSILDGCDGEMSRVTYRGSHLGEWFDTVGDDLTNYGFFAGTAWGLYVATGWWGYLVAGTVTVGCGAITSGIEYRYLWKIGSGDLLKYPLGVGKAPSTAETPKGKLARFFDAISPLFKRDTFVFLTLVGAAAGLLGPFLIAFALGGVGIFVAVIKAELRMASERARAKA